MRRTLLGLWCAAALLFSGCEATVALVPTPTPEPPPVPPAQIRVVCSESLLPAVTTLAAAYQRAASHVQITVLARADTLAAQMVQQGDADVAVLTWLPPAEGVDLFWMTPFAQDGLAVIVNPQNGIAGITLDQLRALFLGQIEDWAGLGGLPGAPQLISREDASGDARLFEERVMRGARVSLTALLAASSDTMLRYVDEDAWSVGYVSTGRLTGSVRALAVDGVPPGPEAIDAGLYPLTRALWLATPQEPRDAARDFVQWVLGPEGQSIVLAQGLRPAPQW